MRGKKAALIFCGSMFLLAGFITLMLPGIVKNQAEQRIGAATGRTLAIGGISINPLTLTITIRDLRFSERGSGKPFAAFSSARITVNPVTLVRMAPVISSARITSPHLTIVRIAADSYNFSDLLQWLPLHPRLSVSNLVIHNGSLDFIDRGLSREMRHELRMVELDIPFVTTMAKYADRFVTPRLSAVLNGSPLRGEGRLRPFPRAVEADATLEFKDALLPLYRAYLPGKLPVRVESGRASANLVLSYRKPGLSIHGKALFADLKVADPAGVPLIDLANLEVAAGMEVGGAEGLRLERVSVQGRQLMVPFGKNERISVASFSLEGGTFNRRDNLLEVTDVILKNGDLRFSRNPKGALLPLDLLYRGGKGAAQGAGAAKPLLHYRIGRVSGTDMTAVFTDNVRKRRPSFAFSRISFALEKLNGPPFEPIPFSLAGRYGQRGTITASGTVRPAPWRIAGNAAVRRIPLADFNVYLPENLAMVVAAGTLDAHLGIALSAKGERMSGTFGGSAGIRALHCLDAAGNDFLKWESLQLDNMKWALGSPGLEIGDVALTRFSSRIAVEKDGSLNTGNLYTRRPDADRTPSARTDKRSLVRIGTIVMQDGTLAFRDHHVAGGYGTTFFNLGGRISGLTSRENRNADLDLRGNLENRSPLRITGQINPLSDDLFANLTVRFSAIDLPPMTPYSGTYLGYEVDSGQLSLDSNYRVENGKLDLESRIFIDRLQFGKSIESDQATTLPVRLAIELLKDRNGAIRIDLPVTGRTDDPRFSAWRVALDVVKNLIVTAVDSPLTLLRSMFGEKDDLGSVGFAPGSSELSVFEREKLLKLAAALNDRPALKIAVVGYVDRVRDDEGYRNELLLKKMRTEKFQAVVREKKNQSGDSAETMRIAGEEYDGYVKAVYAKEQFPKPRTIIGQAKVLPVEEMKKLILSNIVVGDQQLLGLAEERAARVRALLVRQGGLEHSRIIKTGGDIHGAPDKAEAAGGRVEIHAVVE